LSRIRVLDVGVDPIDLDQLLKRVGQAIAARERRTVAYANVHVCNCAAEDPELRRFLERADIVYCDGNGVRLGARMLGQELPHRMTGADWIWRLAAEAEGRWRIWWIGGEPGVAAAAAAALRARHPGLEIGADHGFHARSGPEDAASLARIAAFAPDIVLVGMGTPEQERWVEARRAAIAAPVVWCVGATADCVSGRVRRGPRWLTDHAEWLDRLVSEPGRLWRRFLVGNTRFVIRVLGRRISG
jgi:N-acetylglucosaminyldiphosphoundecaprenol N-acetyl-beta-D-mannosaminyltransferase